MAKMKLATLDRLSEFLTECKSYFATQTEVAENDSDIETYVLNIDDTWYNDNLKIDTTEIV